MLGNERVVGRVFCQAFVHVQDTQDDSQVTVKG